MHGYYHEMFLRYRPHLLRHMRRGFYGDRARNPDNAETRPNFYAMPFLDSVESNADNTGSSKMLPNSSLEAMASMSADTDSISGLIVPLDRSVSISMSGHSGKVAFNPGDSVCICSAGVRHGSLAVGEGISGELLFQPEPARSILSTNAVQAPEAMDCLAGVLESQLDVVPHLANQPGISVDSGTDLNDELEPRPLPPVLAWDGEMVVYSHTPMPLMLHPGFAQIGPHEFYRARGQIDATQQNFGSPGESPEHERP
jgi:hypothetical protein